MQKPQAVDNDKDDDYSSDDDNAMLDINDLLPNRQKSESENEPDRNKFEESPRPKDPMTKPSNDSKARAEEAVAAM